MNPILVALISAFIAAPVGFAREGGGVRNGGTSIACHRGLRSQEVIDGYGIIWTKRTLPVDRRAFARIAYSVLADTDPVLAREWRMEWRRIGPSEKWENEDEKALASFDEYLPDELRYAGCRVHQVASFNSDEWIPRKVEALYLDLHSEIERRILELHESLFILGVKKYDHQNPVRTRYLASKLLTAMGARIANEKFPSFERAIWEFRHSPPDVVAGGYALDAERSDPGPICPRTIYVEPILTDEFQFLSVFDRPEISFSPDAMPMLLQLEVSRLLGLTRGVLEGRAVRHHEVSGDSVLFGQITDDQPAIHVALDVALKVEDKRRLRGRFTIDTFSKQDSGHASTCVFQPTGDGTEAARKAIRDHSRIPR
ncbi:MAG: hypothetical protein JST04_09315 [Bdellovibrionales bacterium]|nr:hypothetical protein [Bdellovibrionales bacterium]